MRFAAAAVVLAAAVYANEAADSTVYSTAYVTVTSCGPAVTECPAESTVVTSSIITVVPTVSVSAPVYGNGTAPVQVPGAPHPTGGLTTVPAACPTYSVKTIVTDVTTVVPTTIYETVDVPCPTSAVVVPPVPSGGVPVPPSNGTVPQPPKPSTPVVEGGASTMAGSVVLAAAAALAAFAL